MAADQKKSHNQSVILHENNGYLLFDSDVLVQPAASLLNGELLQQADDCQKISTGGRGQAWFIRFAGLSLVYRTYLRGGLVARLNRQTYFGWNIENSRSFKEWRLLQWMLKKGLPVPKPVAASVYRWPVFFSPFYRAHILIERIPNVKTLDNLLTEQILPQSVWQAVGRCIRLFHNENIYHADLNANNILLNKENESVYLIDFDKGEHRSDQKNTQWKQENLQRLKRSLLKQQLIYSEYYFSEKNWNDLLQGYE